MLMRSPESRHGTETCYVNHGCRLPECREAHRRARARRVLLYETRGMPGKVPAAEVMPVVENLKAAGWSVAQIERAISSPHALDGIAAGRPCLRPTAEKIKALSGTLPESGWIPAGLTVTRMRSLAAIGWTVTEIRQAAGLEGIGRGIPDHKWVLAETARKVRDAYRKLENTPGGSRRAVNLAAQKGWKVPAAWDDPGTLAWPSDTGTDEPTAQAPVDEVAVQRFLDGHNVPLTRAEKARVVKAIAGARSGVKAQYRDPGDVRESGMQVKQRLRLSGTQVKRLRESA